MIIVNKADNDLIKSAEITQREYKNALQITSKPRQNHIIEVLMCSSLKSHRIRGDLEFYSNFIKCSKRNDNFIKIESPKNKWMWNSVNNTVNEIISKDVVKKICYRNSRKS